MKYLHFLACVLSLLLYSCANNSEDPQTETILPIVQDYLPSTVSFSVEDSEWVGNIKDWAAKQVRVDNLSELPADPLGFSDAYSGINFNKYTLLLWYDIHNWPIDTYRSRYYRDNIEGIYNWNIRVGTATPPDDSASQWYFSRYAILVNKIPADKDVKVWFSLGALNWGWE